MKVASFENEANIGDLGQAIAQIRSLRRETVRREILKNDRIDLLASHVLGYSVEPFHLEMMRFQSEAKDTCLALAPRGFGKSIILTIVRTIFEIVRNSNIRILIASNTQLQAEIPLREIRSHLEHNVSILEYFGSFVSDSKWTDREIIVAPRTSPAKESTVTTVGVGGPVASRHYDLIIGDDIVDEENARTEVQREKVRTWWYKTLVPCCEPDGRIFVIGTRYHYLDLYGHLIKNEMADKHQIIPAIDSDGNTPWPEKFSLKWLEERRQQMGSTIFNTQYMNDVSLMRGSVFKEEWFRFYDEQPNWEAFHHFIGCDPAATKREALLSRSKADTDWWTIVVGGRERDSRGRYKSDIYLRDIWRGRCTKEEYLEKLKEMNKRYKPLKVMIETVAAQEYLAQDAEKHMPVKRVERTKDKVARAYWLQAFLENGQIQLPDKSLVGDYSTWQALQDELLLFPQAEHDDLFDGLQTMMEGALSVHSDSGGGHACAVGSMRDDVDDDWDFPPRDWDELYV